MGPDTPNVWHRMPRKIQHLVPRRPKIRNAGFPEYQISGDLEVPQLQIRIFRFLEIRMLKIRNSGFLENPKIRIFGFLIFRFVEKSEKSESNKKTSGVESAVFLCNFLLRGS